MKIIDLLQRIANGEEVPKYIKYYDKLHQKEDIMMCCYNNIIYKLDNNIIDLLDEAEIMEEEKKDDFTGWKMYQNGKEVCSMDCSAEEKKLPEKIDEYMDIGKGITYTWSFSEKKLKDTINEVIDYLKSKGE